MARETLSAPPVQVPKLPPQPRQRRRGLLLFGVIVVAGGGVLAYHTVNELSDRTQVVVMSRDVPVGQSITVNDVTTTMVGAEDLVATVPGRELPRLIGMRAAVDLVSGMLVQRKLVTDQLVPLGDQQLVPIAVKPSRLPARGLRPGDFVLVVSTPDTPTAKPPKIEGVVDQAKGPDTDGLMVVDLIVKNMDGPTLAALAAEGRVALVLNPRRP
ncbi:SAF domain-containing protein [Nonomuraea sp. NPDC050556]|uniref:SAF domain-containing protein n=1 Tax=Nonomuraea sp. NPDC050556 TaxID=3364369 RepID=UPI003789CDA9